MNMTHEEICREYRQAKDKNRQIQILADLNQCTPQDILTILSDNGEISGVPDKPKRKLSAPLSPEVVHDMIRLFEQGHSNAEVAERLGLTPEQVNRKKYDLRKKGYLFNIPAAGKPAEELTDCSEPVASPTAPNSTSSILDLLTVLEAVPGVQVISASVRLADNNGKHWQLEMRAVNHE